MKKFILSCLLLVGISTAISAQGIVEGAKAPDFSAKKVDGTTFTLSSLQGKYVVLDFWGSWCKWCIKGFPDMKTAYARHKGKVEFVGIACRDTEEKWKTATAKYELPWISVLNPAENDLVKVYQVQGFPTKIVVDPQGRIAKVILGEDPAFYTYLDGIL
ncbi:MAG: TlpA family protein disulfide reductase, partial [Bacteroidales bacterium]|nr:TlpA family protein disulfide reductase [Bacteroidales bacterium]